jgi:long-chain-fatty-acyl-CoA reductase
VTRQETIPIVLAGHQRLPGADAFTFDYGGRLEISLARPTIADIQGVVSTDPEPLRSLPVDDLTIFFDQVRQAWMDPTNHWRRTALELASLATGYAPRMVESDIDYLGHTLTRAKQYDFIETDLGDPYLLDEWRPDRAVLRRCWPQGLVAHIMVGNVPLASLFALYRSLATKNVTVAKVPSRDVVSALCFANCIVDTDSDHPVSRSLTVCYWEAGSPAEDCILEAANVVSAWGQGSTIDSLRTRTPRRARFIEFGPRRSFAYIRNGVQDMDDVAMRVAFDVVTYDQEACFSAQEVYVEGDATHLGERVAEWLRRFEVAVPRRTLTVDESAHVQRARLEAVADGWRVLGPESTSWTVVTTDSATLIPDHPLARFVYIHPVSGIDEVLAQVDEMTQSVSCAPWEDVSGVAAQLTAAGADRVVQVGRMSRFRPGCSHDGFYPMREMVRWVTIEREIGFKYRFTAASTEEYDELLYGPVLALARAEAEAARDPDAERALEVAG